MKLGRNMKKIYELFSISSRASYVFLECISSNLAPVEERIIHLLVNESFSVVMRLPLCTAWLYSVALYLQGIRSRLKIVTFEKIWISFVSFRLRRRRDEVGMRCKGTRLDGEIEKVSVQMDANYFLLFKWDGYSRGSVEFLLKSKGFPFRFPFDSFILLSCDRAGDGTKVLGRISEQLFPCSDYWWINWKCLTFLIFKPFKILRSIDSFLKTFRFSLPSAVFIHKRSTVKQFRDKFQPDILFYPNILIEKVYNFLSFSFSDRFKWLR